MTPFTLQIPTYQCHKRVQALKINAIWPSPRGMLLGFEDQRFAPHEVHQDWYLKHDPVEGGYLVIYEDGYMSFSPAAAFEAGYTLADGGSALPAGDAAELARAWHAFAKEWPGGPSEVEAALASRDAEIERLRAAAKADEIQSCPACFTVFPTQAVDQCVECQRMSKPSAADCRKCEAATPEFSEAAARLVGPATQAAREVGK